MKYKVNYSIVLVLSSLCIGANAFAAAPASVPESLPYLQCDQGQCSESRIFSNGSRFDSSPQTISPTPNTIGPPAAQRFSWGGSSAPCVNIRTLSPQPTLAAPYEYVKVTELPVPLGSTHATLIASFEAVMAGRPAGSGGDAGALQVKRSSSNDWTTVQLAYALVAPGTPTPPIIYQTATYHGLVDLAKLGGVDQGTVPGMIDVRLGVYPSYTASYSEILTNYACKGQLDLAF